MFPLKDNIPAKQFPVINIWLIVINVLCFLYQIQLGPHMEGFVFSYGFIPARFFYIQEQNWLDVTRFVPVFSSMFLHGNFLHLISNMWMLWIFGDNVEDSMGHGRYLVFYLLCGVVSVFAQAWAGPASRLPLVGASGAIAGVLGAYFLLYPKARILTLIPIIIFFYLIDIPAYFFLGFWFLLQFLQGYSQLAGGSIAQGGVAFWAHIGGFLSGVILIHLFRKRRKS